MAPLIPGAECLASALELPVCDACFSPVHSSRQIGDLFWFVLGSLCEKPVRMRLVRKKEVID